MIPYKRGNKYGAKKTVYRGQKYDSRKESEYAALLDGLLSAKKIKKWERQVRFKLPSLDWFETGAWRSYYAADFVITTLDSREHIVEVKGILLPENKIKYSFVKYIYRRPLHIVYTTGINKMDTDWLTCTECPIKE